MTMVAVTSTSRCCLAWLFVFSLVVIEKASSFSVVGGIRKQSSVQLYSSPLATPTELPDSLDDSAEIAAQACAAFAESAGSLGRCRVDFDTSAGDETYTLLKSSTEFMQKFVTGLSYSMVPGLLQQRQNEMMKVAQARAELQALLDADQKAETNEDDADSTGDDSEQSAKAEDNKVERKNELMEILRNGGRDPNQPAWDGPVVRVYFPDEGSAALARRDWNPTGSPDEAKVPPCVKFSSCGGVQIDDVSKDMLVFFFCPKASESDEVEELLLETETKAVDQLKLTVFVNPNLVDMGVTGTSWLLRASYGLLDINGKHYLILSFSYICVPLQIFISAPVGR